MTYVGSCTLFPFDLQESFSVQGLTINGNDYSVERFKQIVQERYIISKRSNTSYTDVGKISPVERQYLLDIIIDEINREKERIEQQKQALQKH